MAKIFLLEDDFSFGKSLKTYLELKNYSVNWARDLHNARQNYSQPLPDIFILDWNLPDGTGIDFFKFIKEKSIKIPVFFLTAKDEEESAIEALSYGAIDYLRKPFGQGELLVKIKKALGEAHNPSKKFRFDDLVLNAQSRDVEYAGTKVELRPREFDILHAILKKSDQVISREDLLQQIDDSGELFDRAIDGHVSRLRKAIQLASNGALEIKAVYGSGYQLKRKDKKT